MSRTFVIGALVAALAVAAFIDSLRGSGDTEQAAPVTRRDDPSAGRLVGPDVPAPGALPGDLVLAEDEGCRLRVLVLADVRLGSAGPRTLCRVSVSPAGGLAAAAIEEGGGGGARVVALIRLGDPPEVTAVLGLSRGEVAWARDGSALAWCGPDGRTVVREVGSGRERRLAGCSPRFAPDGAVLTVPSEQLAGEILRDGEVLLDESDLRSGLGAEPSGPIDVLGLDVASSGLVAVSVSRRAPTGTVVVLELWSDGALEGAFELPALLGPGNVRFGEYLRFAPAGGELAIGYTPGPGELSLVDFELERVLIRSINQRGFAWSPDGAWLAVAVEDGVEVFGAVRDDPAYELPVAAGSLAWAPDEKEGGPAP